MNTTDLTRFFRAGPPVPGILSQPVTQSGRLSGTATLCVSAIGALPLSYQWWFNGTNRLEGATNACLVLTNVQASHAGEYFVVVSNAYGAVTSAVARVEVETLWLEIGGLVVQGELPLIANSEPGRVLQVLTSTNLVDWSVLGTITNQTGRYTITVPTTNRPVSFYRLRQVQ